MLIEIDIIDRRWFLESAHAAKVDFHMGARHDGATFHHNVFSTCLQLSFGRRILRRQPPFHVDGSAIFQQLHRQ